MKALTVILLILAVVAGYMYATGQLRVVDGSVVYIPPPSHEEEHGHSGAEHDLSYCLTAERCAKDIALNHQALVGTQTNGTELKSVNTDGVQVVYDYVVSITRDEFQRASPPPKVWFKQMRDEFCTDELNWPMMDLGVVTVMRFRGANGSSLGEVRIENCIR